MGSERPSPDGEDQLRDSLLIERAILRQKGGATLLHARYQRLVRSIVARVSRNQAILEELVQEAFLNAFRNISTLETSSRLRAWLASIARYVSLKHLRDRREERHEELLAGDATMDGFADGAPRDPESLAISADVRHLLDRIESPFREVLELRFLAELPLSEIAQRQGISIPLVKYRLRQGRQKLLELVEQQDRAGHET